MSNQPIVEVVLKPSVDALRLEWGMTVTEDHRWLWEHDQLKVVLCCEPTPDLRAPELLSGPFADRQIAEGESKTRGVGFNIPIASASADYGRSTEVSHSTFRSEISYSDEHGRCYPLVFDLTEDDKKSDGAIANLGVRWTVDTPNWTETKRTFTIQFGYTNKGGKFEIVQHYTITLPEPKSTETPTPSRKIEDDLYVFISYARPNEAIAKQVEAYLIAAGVKVFRDTSTEEEKAVSIHKGENWDIKIERALRETHRMVLLLSTASMPERKEVHREWFYFDQNVKPIYPLYLEKCDLHSRMYSYNYIDVNRLGLKTALEQLLNELGREFTIPDRIKIKDEVEERTLPEALDALHTAIKDPNGMVELSKERAREIVKHTPANVTEYRLCRITEWSQQRYQLDNRFVNLTLIIDRGEDADGIRWQPDEKQRPYKRLQDVLAEVENPAFVLLGAPGSGKSTLLRRYQLDHEMDRIRDDGDKVTFFIQLNGFKSDSGSPREWLDAKWKKDYSSVASLDTLLAEGRLILLLDALNEMPHKTKDEYYDRVDLWREFTQDVVRNGNRVIFSCRTLDYSASISSKELPVPHIDVQPMKDDQIQTFLHAYIPTHAAMVWGELEHSEQLDLFRTPYFLKLLCDQVEDQNEIPRGRASLFTGFVRQVITREKDNELFKPDTLLTSHDHTRINAKKWRTPFDLPERGILIPRISDLAYTMQQTGLKSEGTQIRSDYDDACDILNHERAEDILKAGISMNVLDEDLAALEILFFHQLLQEFFAARKLALQPNPELVQVEWHVDKVTPTLEETIATLADSDPLPPLPQTGWEETTVMAAAMAKSPDEFVRGVMEVNLPLAARCAANPEVTIDSQLKSEIQQALIARTQDMNADLRARIAAGLALGDLGDPRFERRSGPHGEYLMPPMKTIAGGTYTIGDDNSQYDDEKPAHPVDLDAFQIGQFPVTNAEYKLFMDAGGYEHEDWWDTDDALAWLRGEGSTEGSKQSIRDRRNQLQSIPDETLRSHPSITSEQAEAFIWLKNMTDNQFEEWLIEQFPGGETFRQPVVGICWYEARAYCKWLSAQTGSPFELASEAQWEAAARGKDGWIYPYGNDFDVTRGNTFESHIRRPTPVGIYVAAPEHLYDMSGNVYDWTLSIYDQDAFPYPYKADERENISSSAERVLRGGSWLLNQDGARAVFRLNDLPGLRHDGNGFRLVVSAPSL